MRLRVREEPNSQLYTTGFKVQKHREYINNICSLVVAYIYIYPHIYVCVCVFVCVCFLRIWVQNVVIFLHIINCVIFLTETVIVYCSLRAQSSNLAIRSP
jgi:hypothetical protein